MSCGFYLLALCLVFLGSVLLPVHGWRLRFGQSVRRLSNWATEACHPQLTDPVFHAGDPNRPEYPPDGQMLQSVAASFFSGSSLLQFRPITGSIIFPLHRVVQRTVSLSPARKSRKFDETETRLALGKRACDCEGLTISDSDLGLDELHLLKKQTNSDGQEEGTVTMTI